MRYKKWIENEIELAKKREVDNPDNDGSEACLK